MRFLGTEEKDRWEKRKHGNGDGYLLSAFCVLVGVLPLALNGGGNRLDERRSRRKGCAG